MSGWRNVGGGWRMASSGWVLALLACAHTPPPPPVLPTTVPSAAVEMMCSRMRSEGMTAQLRVVKISQPLITPPLMQALAAVTPRGSKVVAPVAVAGMVPVESASCAKRMIDSLDPVRDADVMVLEFSSPFSNPFAHGQVGVIARLSLGDEGPSWYWIAIGERQGAWAAGRPTILSVRE